MASIPPPSMPAVSGLGEGTVGCVRDTGRMPLTLITGPANAAKAGAVLERFRAALPREPVLVVPTPADAEHYQRELSAEGIVVG